MAKEYAIIHDLLTNRPAAGVENREFVATDTKERYRDTGAAWDLIGTLDHAALSNLTNGDPHSQYQLSSEKSQPSGYAPLDANGELPAAHIPALAINEVFEATSDADMTALTAQRGDLCVRTDYAPDRSYMLMADDATILSNWRRVTFGDVVSVDGKTGVVDLSGDYAAISHVGSTDGHPLATTTEDGLMAAADKAKTERALDVETSQRVVYVGPAGSDFTGDGTSANRWATIQHAVNQARTTMQPAFSASHYKVVCATGTYDMGANELIIPPNLLASFNTGGQGGIWIVSETDNAADVLITSTNANRCVIAYGSATIEKVTLENDTRALQVVGGKATTVFAVDCTMRRRSASDGGNAAIAVSASNMISVRNSPVSGQRFSYGLFASYGAAIAKSDSQPTGTTANEGTGHGGVIR